MQGVFCGKIRFGGDDMNKWLLIWNIVVTMMLLVLAISGCAGNSGISASQFNNLAAQVEANQQAVISNFAVIENRVDLCRQNIEGLAVLIDSQGEVINQPKDVINQHAEALNSHAEAIKAIGEYIEAKEQQTSDLQDLMKLLQLLGYL